MPTSEQVADEKLERQLCHAKCKRRDNLSFQTQTCEFHASAKKPTEGQIDGGSKLKTKRMDILESKAQALDNTTKNSSPILNSLTRRQKQSMTSLKLIMDLKPKIEEELERKRAMKVIIALHAAFYLATDVPDRTTSSLQKFTSLKFYLPPISTKCYIQ